MHGQPFHVRDLEHVIYKDDCADFSKCWERSLATGQDLKARCRLHLPEGGAHARWFDIEAHAVKDAQGRVQRWVGTIFDVDEIVTQTAHAEQRLAEEQAARVQAERLARARDEFMATVSHELRSPLSAITGWSDILARKGSADETLAKAATVIRRNALLQARLIDDLLDMTAVMAGKLTLSESQFDLAALAQQVTLSHLHAAQQKGVALSCKEASPAMVQGDSKRICQVLANLIGNAIKFTDTGGSVEVVPWIEDHAAYVKVKDTGRGIASEFLPRVFDRITQEDASKSRKAGGLGIGLAIAKAVVELHHGAIRADSRGPGAGAEFTFMLPLADDHAARPTPAASNQEDAPDVDLSRLRVLYVDDEQDARDVGQIALSSMGASVKTAASAAEALRLMKAEVFDVMVSDIGMPEMDGLALIQAVRSRQADGNADIPAVALTAFALESERQEGLAAGFDSYVTKPISLRRLGEGVRAAQAHAKRSMDARPMKT